MKQLGLKSVIKVNKYKSFKGDVGKAAESILKRDFKATNPNKKWADDVTDFNVKMSILYPPSIIDIFKKEIISYNYPLLQTFDMLNKAFKRRKKDNATNNRNYTSFESRIAI